MNRRNFLKLTGITAIVPSICSLIKKKKIEWSEPCTPDFFKCLINKPHWISFKDKLPLEGSYFIIRSMDEDREIKESQYICKRQYLKIHSYAEIRWIRTNILFSNENKNNFSTYKRTRYADWNIDNLTLSWKPYFADTDKLPEEGRMVEVLNKGGTKYSSSWEVFSGETLMFSSNIVIISNKSKTINAALVKNRGSNSPSIENREGRIDNKSRYWRYI